MTRATRQLIFTASSAATTTLRKAPFLKMVPMLGSMGCPYTCAFCIDATVPYRPMDFEMLRDDLRFLLTRFKRPLVAWHDPLTNFPELDDLRAAF
jgi:radical SAM superfamily enzyme YgiQ (UPF0313 family)